MIYDFLFTPLIQRPQVLDEYALPHEWPKNDFSSYTTLTLCCKEIHEETKAHFELHYLPNSTMYFDITADLHSLCQTLSPLGPLYQAMRLSLRTYYELAISGRKPIISGLKEVVMDNHELLTIQPSDPSLHGHGMMCHMLFTPKGECVLSPPDNPTQVYGEFLSHSARNGTCIDVWKKRLAQEDGLEVRAAQICRHPRTTYFEMADSVKLINWTDWDAVDKARSVTKMKEHGTLTDRPVYKKFAKELQELLGLPNTMTS